MTTTLRGLFILALAVTGLNSAFAQQGLIIEGNSLSDRVFNSDEVPGDDIFAVDFTVTNAGTLQDIMTWGQISGGGPPGLGLTFHAYVLRPLGTNFQVMTDSGTLTVADVGTNFYAVPPFSLEAGDLIAHCGSGIPLSTGTGGPSVCYFNDSTIPTPSVGQVLELPSAGFPVYNDGGRNYAIAINIGARVNTGKLPIPSIALLGDSVVVTWPAAVTNVLLQTTDLAAGLWTTNTSYVSANGTNILTITPPDGNQFFRLGNP